MIRRLFLIVMFSCSIFGNEIKNSRETSITRAINNIGPSVVSINVEQSTSSFSFDPFRGFIYPREIFPMKSSGSGVIISPDGFILTNSHVIENADEITVILSDESEFEAEIIGRDPKTDIAVLRIKPGDKELSAVSFGNSDSLSVGDWVMAIGNPFGLGGTVTAGIVSARGRDIGSGPYDDYIQTDASINRGN